MQAATPKVWGKVELECTCLGLQLGDQKGCSRVLTLSAVTSQLSPLCRYANWILENCAILWALLIWETLTA